MHKQRRRFINALTTIVIAAALALTGAVPSFAAESQFEGAPEAPDITAEAALVMDAGSGQIIYADDDIGNPIVEETFELTP